MTIKTIFKLPDYTRSLPANAMLSGKEIAELLGIADSTFREWARAGKFPQPDFNSRFGGSSIAKKHHWRLSTLRKYEAEQQCQNSA